MGNRRIQGVLAVNICDDVNYLASLAKFGHVSKFSSVFSEEDISLGFFFDLGAWVWRVLGGSGEAS